MTGLPAAGKVLLPKCFQESLALNISIPVQLTGHLLCWRSKTTLNLMMNLLYLKLAEKSKIELESNPKDESQYTIVKLNGRDVTDDIRSSLVGAAVSIVSKLSGVRKYLVTLQRELADSGNAVLEGRDTGSVVFPNALLKIYLSAGIEQRVRRRELQNMQKGQKVDSKEIKTEISTRDLIDSSRSDSPLTIPQDAVVIDNTNLTILETFEKIRDIYNERIRFKN